MRRIFLSACLVVLAAASVARAQECDRNDDSQQMMTICAGEDYQAADAKLNKAYKDLVGANDDEAEQAAADRAARLDRLPRRRVRLLDRRQRRRLDPSDGGFAMPDQVDQ